MSKFSELTENIQTFLNSVEDSNSITDEQYEDFLGNVNLNFVYQTLCRLAAPVHEYEAGIEPLQMAQYYGSKLFDCNAIRVYIGRNYQFELEKVSILHTTEVWLLENLTLAVTSCHTTEVKDNHYVASYRAYKGDEWPGNEEFDMDYFIGCLETASNSFVCDGQMPIYED